jgi:hypothetical protein
MTETCDEPSAARKGRDRGNQSKRCSPRTGHSEQRAHRAPKWVVSPVWQRRHPCIRLATRLSSGRRGSALRSRLSYLLSARVLFWR